MSRQRAFNKACPESPPVDRLQPDGSRPPRVKRTVLESSHVTGFTSRVYFKEPF